MMISTPLRGGPARPPRGGVARRRRPPGRRLRPAPPGQPARDVVAGVTVHRLDVQRHQGAGLGVYLGEYLAFFRARCGWPRDCAHPQARYGLVQVHTLPDFLAFAALPLRTRRRPGDPRPPRGDAGVLRSFLCGGPAIAPPAPRAPGAAVDRALDATSSRSTRPWATGCSGSASRPTRSRSSSTARRSPGSTRGPPAPAVPGRRFARLVYAGGLTPDLRGRRRRRGGRDACATDRPELSVAARASTAGATPRRAAPRPGRAARDRRRGDLPRPDPDRRRPGGGRGRRHRPRPDAPRPSSPTDPLDQGVRVRGDGQARGRIAPAAGRAHVRATDGRDLRAGRRRGPRDRAGAIVDDPAAREARVARAHARSWTSRHGSARAVATVDLVDRGRCAG